MPYEDDREALSAAMDRYADGDGAAFAEVYGHLGERLYAFFLRRTRDVMRAEDLVQQTFLNMHMARMSYARSSDVVPWAFAIARNLLVDMRRRGKREVLFASADDEAAALDAKVERFAIPDGAVSSKEVAARAMAALASMPEQHREAYMLVRQEGLSIAQAAEVLGTTQTAVKLRAHRAYEALRAALAGA